MECERTVLDDPDIEVTKEYNAIYVQKHDVIYGDECQQFFAPSRVPKPYLSQEATAEVSLRTTINMTFNSSVLHIPHFPLPAKFGMKRAIGVPERLKLRTPCHD